MPAGSDERAVSELVGAVILFAFLFLTMALWQAQVVPAQNAQVEFNHHQLVQGDLVDVRNAIVSAPGGTTLPSISINMAPEYPPRTIFINPARQAGTIRTAGTEDPAIAVTVRNATAADEEIADFWDGSAKTLNSGSLSYEPGYNHYTAAPRTVYENTLLYNRHGQGVNVTLASQAVVSGTSITVVTLNGSLSRNQVLAYPLDLETLSSSTRSIAVTDAPGGNVTITLPTRRNATAWNRTFAETGELRSQGGHVVDVRPSGTVDGFNLVTVEFEGGVNYTLQSARVGVGTGATTPGKAYIVDVNGDGDTISTAGQQRLTVEVRDRFNNPVDGVLVRNGSGTTLNGGSLDVEQQATDSEGQATFEFSPGLPGTATIEFNISDDATVTDEELVTFTVFVTGGQSPSMTALTAHSTAAPCGGPGAPSDCYDTISFDYTVSDESQVANITVSIVDQDGVELATQTTVVNAQSDSGTIQVDISDEQVETTADLFYAVVVYDDTAATETDTGLVPKP